MQSIHQNCIWCGVTETTMYYPARDETLCAECANLFTHCDSLRNVIIASVLTMMQTTLVHGRALGITPLELKELATNFTTQPAYTNGLDNLIKL